MKQRVTLFGMVAIALIFTACGGDSGNNGTEVEGGSSSSVVRSSSSSVGTSSSSLVISSSSVGGASSSSIPLSSSVGISSSSIPVSSSSVNASPSSSSVLCSNTYGTNTVTDCRDSRTYKTVVIGSQTWMAENLNYAYSSAMSSLKGDSWCYENSADSCAKYGRLYTWTVAMGLASSYQSASAAAVISVPHQGVCPYGWHIPTNDEWTTLEDAVGGSDVAGTMLKSTSGWESGNGTDSYGFSALPGGYFNGLGFSLVDYYGLWWTATEYSSTDAYFQGMSSNYESVATDYYFKSYGRSLRCLKD
ncbi:MAG: fibrobacter succinogenes major paralogous domain-containing protein [Fibrobacteraceae bacterium]